MSGQALFPVALCCITVIALALLPEMSLLPTPEVRCEVRRSGADLCSLAAFAMSIFKASRALAHPSPAPGMCTLAAHCGIASVACAIPGRC